MDNSLVVFIVSVLKTLSSVAADDYCYDQVCYGVMAHCCSFDETQCCYYAVYSLWWFWFIWFVFLLLIISCCVMCFRRRRRSGYVIMGQQPNPEYGTVTTTMAQPYPYVQPYAQHGAPQPATAPPPYNGNEKPPAYMP